MALRRLVSNGCCGAIISKDCDIPGDSTDCFQFHCAVILAGRRSEDESNPATSHGFKSEFGYTRSECYLVCYSADVARACVR